MLLLALTTSKVQVITSATCTVDVVADFIDTTQADPPIMKGSTTGPQCTAITTAATTDIVSVPAASTTRNVKEMNIRNKHASSSVDVTVQRNMNGTLFEMYKATLVAGATLQWVEGQGFQVLPPAASGTLIYALASDDAGGQNIATVQPWFPTTGGVTVAASTTYIFDGQLVMLRAAGVTSHTTSQLFGGTATLTSIQYAALVQLGDVETLLPLDRVTSRVATATVVKAASTSATEAIQISIEGIVRINAAGTFIPQFIFSAIPGGAPTIKANSWFRLVPIGSNTFVTQGVWA